MKELNLIGKTYNKLTALSKTKISGRCHYVCRCVCGNSKTVESWHLSSGYTKSCGCLQKEAHSYRCEKNRIGHGLANAHRVISYYKKNAKKRSIAFSLSEQGCIDILKQKCFYCGREPFSTMQAKGLFGAFVYSGIDRVDNNKGYFSDNVVPCCRDCNSMKKDLQQNDFLNIISLINNNLNQLNHDSNLSQS